MRERGLLIDVVIVVVVGAVVAVLAVSKCFISTECPIYIIFIALEDKVDQEGHD